MFWRKQKKILEQARRITELEEILCPCQQHEYIKYDYHISCGSGIGDEEIVYHYICKRCKKQIQTTREL